MLTVERSGFFGPKDSYFLSPQTTSGYCPGAVGVFCYFLCEILESLADVERLYYCPLIPLVDTNHSAYDLNTQGCIQMRSCFSRRTTGKQCQRRGLERYQGILGSPASMG